MSPSPSFLPPTLPGGLSNDELAAAFTEWNSGELESFLVEISAIIFAKKDDQAGENATGSLIDVILDKTGMKGTGKWTVQQAADLSVAAPTIEASLDARFLSGLKDERVAAASFYDKIGVSQPSASASGSVDKAELVKNVRAALYASKICSYAQGMNIIRAKSEAQGWGVDLAALARIWKGGCIIRAAFLDDIRAAYARDPSLASLLVDPFFGQAVADRQAAWRDVVALVSVFFFLFYFLGGRGGRGGRRSRKNAETRKTHSLSLFSLFSFSKKTGREVGRRCPGNDQLPRLLRHLPPCAPPRQPGPGAARLLRVRKRENVLGKSYKLSFFSRRKEKNSLFPLFFFKQFPFENDNDSSHTYERTDGKEGWFHTVWSASNSADSITTSGYTT